MGWKINRPKKLGQVIVGVLLGLLITVAIPGPAKAQAQGGGGNSSEPTSPRDIMKQFRKLYKQQNQQMNDLIRKFFEDREEFFNKGLNQHGLQGLNFKSQLGGMSSTKVTKKEKDGHIIYELDASSIDPNALEVDVKDGMVTVRGQTRQEKTNDKKNQFFQSTSISTFSRSFPVPAGVEPSSINVEKKNNKILIKFRKRRV